jgi:hypothetical protein
MNKLLKKYGFGIFFKIKTKNSFFLIKKHSFLNPF